MSSRGLSKWMLAVLCAAICALVPAGSANAGSLPDGRVYEKVSSLTNYGSEVDEPEKSGIEFSDAETELPFQASADGNRVAFVGGPSTGGNESTGYRRGNEYLGTHLDAGGWSESNISPVGFAGTAFEAFSSDLTVGYLESIEPLTSMAPGFGEEPLRGGDYDVLYSTATSGSDYAPFFTTKPPYREPYYFRTAGTGISSAITTNGRTLAFAGGSADSRHLLFLTNDALTGASEGRPAAEGGPDGSFQSENNLYESVDGQLRLVNVLPNGTTRAGAIFGNNVGEGFPGVRFSRVISKDGSRIFWTDLNTGHIYVRENGTTTLEISAAGQYQTASSDGADVFYTNGDLYEYEVEGAHTTDLTPGVPVAEVVGASEDGQYVYYVTKSGEFKLWHSGATTTIAVTPVTRGEVTPDGHSVVFISTNPESPQNAVVHVYNADMASLYCVSCTATGTHGFLPITNYENVYLPRWISSDGSHVFFDSNQGLVPDDANGRLDIYEWARPGSNGCTESAGCTYLLSGGASTQESYLVDTSEDGHDVFMVTSAKLVADDNNELYDLYDARVDGYSPISPPVCTGSGCQGVPGAAPVFATPPSVTFEGVGNFVAPAHEAKAKPKPKKKAKHRKKKPKRAKAKKGARNAAARKHSGAKGGRS